MKTLTISTEILKSIFSIFKKLKVNSKTIHIFDNIKFEIKGNICFITYRDTNNILTIELKNPNATYESEFCFLLSNDFFKVLDKIKDNFIHFTLDNDKLLIESNKDEFKYKIDNLDNYPNFNETFNKVAIINSQDLINYVSNCSKYTSNNDLRPSLQCVNLDITNSKIVATDAHRLIYFNACFNSVLKDCNLLLDKETQKIIKGLKNDYSSTLFESENYINIQFLYTDFVLNVSQHKVDAKYPNYFCVIPENNPIKLNLNKSELQSILDKAMLFTNKTTYKIVLNCSVEKTFLTANDPDFDKEYKRELTANCNDNITIGLNAKFLDEILSEKFVDNSFTIEMSTNNRAIVINGNDFLYLQMPLMLNQ